MNGHCNHLALKFSVCVKERQDRLPVMYWLPKLHKKTGERGGSVVECRTPEREVRGSRPTAAVLCP